MEEICPTYCRWRWRCTRGECNHQRRHLEVLSGDAFRRLGLNDLEVNVVGLGNCTNSSGAGVALWRRQRLALDLDLNEYVQFNG